jgi:hypothetical protein
MLRIKRPFLAAILALTGSIIFAGAPAFAKEKFPAVSADDPTLRLYKILDDSYGGKLDEYYLLADIYKDPKTDQEFRRVLKLEYDKAHAFGKLRIYIRSVGQMTPQQLKTYTPKEIYGFGEVDTEKFTKTDPGALGRPGDLYFQAKDSQPLSTVPIDDNVRKEYDTLVTQYIIPALEKK